ncbi:MAG: UDP-N-acetylmuramate--L-alanine ligase [Campylobacterota bacterium]|nr:UDP-N-acetylmuramate--L-alanine ligase [Campylobacterota bacterium]
MKVHFVGIGGIGLSALARFMKYKGDIVSGSDIKDTPITQKLKDENIKVDIPQSKNNIRNQDLIIYSAAVLDNNPEIIEARNQELKILTRKEALSTIMKDTKNYCVCAAHGKSTTTAILSSVLQSSAIIGAISKEFNSNFRYISNTLAFEADESDESFIFSNPYCSIVLNTEPEHMEYYNYDKVRFYNAYKKFLDIAKVKVINAEDDYLKDYKGDAIRLYPSKDIKDIEYILEDDEPYTKFTLKDIGEFKVWGFGNHIALNTASVILATLPILNIEDIRKNLLDYKGIKKRFDILQKKDDFILIDDYAHHPTEIKVTIESVKLYQKYKKVDNIIVIWQPHKYSRTIDNLEAFKSCFMGCDELIILPVWSVAEEIKDIDFKKEFSSYNITFCDKVDTTDANIELIKDNNIIKTINKGIVVGVGAGDITYQLRYK